MFQLAFFYTTLQYSLNVLKLRLIVNALNNERNIQQFLQSAFEKLYQSTFGWVFQFEKSFVIVLLDSQMWIMKLY